MNAYYHRNPTNNSNNEIFKELLLGSESTAPTWKRHVDNLLSLLAAMVAILTGSVARRMFRVFSFTAILFAFIALIGAVEAGVLGLGTGFLIGLPLLGIEYLCLRKK